MTLAVAHNHSHFEIPQPHLSAAFCAPSQFGRNLIRALALQYFDGCTLLRSDCGTTATHPEVLHQVGSTSSTFPRVSSEGI